MVGYKEDILVNGLHIKALGDGMGQGGVWQI